MKNYVVIGGSSGIGKELVSILAEKGNKVYASYNNNPIENSENVTVQKLDVLSEELHIENFPEKIHGFAYCPGSINLKPFHRFKEEHFLEDFKLQVLGATKLIKQLLPNLKNAEGASIVLFSTIAVQQGFNFHSQVAMSKGAIEGLTRSLAAEFAPSIRVNAVAPSLTNTPLAGRLLNSPEKIEKQSANNPLKRIGSAKEVAEAAAFLITDQSSWVTGQIMHIDGGHSVIK